MKKHRTRYKYYIEEEKGKYYFALYPNCSNVLPIGRSGVYNSKKEAQIGISLFQKFIRKDKDAFVLKEVMSDRQSGMKFYSFELKENDDGIIFYRTAGYWQKINSIKAIKAIYLNIDADLKERTSE